MGDTQIVKVILKQFSGDRKKDIKYIYCGELPLDIKQLTTKLEAGSRLSPEEETRLNRHIPYWKTKFGDLSPMYSVKFVYARIGPTHVGKHVVKYILDVLEKPGPFIVYSYPRMIYYSELYELVSYIFHRIAPGSTQKSIKMGDIVAECKKLRLGDTDLLEGVDAKMLLNIEECINNPVFHDYYKSIPRTIGSRYYMRIGQRELYSYEGLSLLEDPISGLNFSYEDQQTFTSVDTSRLEDIADYLNTTTNNTYYVLLRKDVNDYIQAKGGLYPNMNLYLNAIQIKPDSIPPVHLDHWIQNDGDPILVQDNLLLKNWVWTGGDIGIHIPLDLVHIFREIEPTHHLPVIKFVKDGEVQLYNIYKPFFRTLDEQQTTYYMFSKDIVHRLQEDISVYERISIRRFKHLIDLDYLLLKWRVDDMSIMNLYLFENGFLCCEFKTGGRYVEATRLIELSELVNKMMMKIKKKYKLTTELPNLNPSKYIHPTPGTIYNGDLLKVSYKYVCHIAGHTLNTDLMSELMNKLKQTGPATQILVLSGSFNEKIKLIYSGTHGFYHVDNIKHYIRHYLKEKPSRGMNKEKLHEDIQRIFPITIETLDSILKELADVNLQLKNTDLLNHVSCEIEFDKQLNIYIHTEGVNGYTVASSLMATLDAVLKDILTGSQCVRGEETTKVVQELDIPEISDLPDLTIDMELLEKLEHLELPEAPVAEKKEEPLQDIKLKQLLGKKEKLSVVNYMKELRRRYDPDLYEPKVKGKVGGFMYDRACPQTEARQPMIVTKEQLDKFNPEAITGYLKYRNNYYICPRIWDARAEKPISVRDFIAHGLRSPYTDGESVTAGPKKNLITDKYTVIIRKPTTSLYWTDDTQHKDWPKELKHTERDAYPALTKSSKHPEGICIPCCGKNPPLDFDASKKEIQQFFKPFNYETCDYKPEYETGEGESQSVETFCKNDDYISNGSTNLKNKNCRLAFLPEELNVLLNNAQELFTNQTETGLNDGANLFLRRGVVYDNVTNIIDTFANIYEKKTKYLISQIINNLSPLEFMALNNGRLVNIFAGANDQPMTGSERDRYQRFLDFYPEVLEYLNIDIHTMKESETRILYKLCISFYNYISYLSSPNEVKQMEYVIELFSRDHSWSKGGLNIILFDKTISNFKCLDTFNYKTKRCVLLIEEEADVFIPIVHVTSKFGKLSVSGIIDLNDSINLTSSQVSSLYKQKPTLTRLIESAKDRLSHLIKLLYIQSNLCNYNLIYFNSQLEKALSQDKLQITAQYQGIGQSGQVEYINVGNDILLPVYPAQFIRGVPPGDYIDLHLALQKQKMTCEKLYTVIYDTPAYSNLLNYGYHIQQFLIDDIKGVRYVCAAKFTNGLEIHLHPIIYDTVWLGKIRTEIFNHWGKTISVQHAYTTNLLKYPELLSPVSDDQMAYSLFNVFNLMNEMLKYNLSHYIYINMKSQQIIQFKDVVLKSPPNPYLIIESLDKILIGSIVHKKKIGLKEYCQLLLGDGTTVTRQRVQSTCDSSDKLNFCFTGSTAKIIIPEDYYPALLLSVTRDLVNNKLDTDKILKGKYVVPINDLLITRIGGSLSMSTTTNMIISPDELAYYVQRNLISKYKKNFELRADPNPIENLVSMSEEELAFLKDYVLKNLSQKLTSILGLASILSSIQSSSQSGKYSAEKETSIHSTVFNSEGIYNPHAKLGSCKFPFRDKRGDFIYKCGRAKQVFKSGSLPGGLKDADLICPVETNKDKTVKSWGYCPEKPGASILRLKTGVTEVYDSAAEGKMVPCAFPFIYHNKRVVNPLTGEKPLLKIGFSCERDDMGSWCYTRSSGVPPTQVPLIGTLDMNQVFKGDWSMGELDAIEKSGTLQLGSKFLQDLPEHLKYKEGRCSLHSDEENMKKIEAELELEGVTEITRIEDYKPDYCKLSVDKKGYSRKQLYLFGKNVLHLPYKVLLNDNNKILTKQELCDMFSNKIREMKKATFDLQTAEEELDYTKIYTKDPGQCEQGESKGGYSFTELRDMAITYFGLTEEEARTMKKPELCNYVLPKLNYQITTELEESLDPDSIYPANKNINLCAKPIKRGGLNKKAVNQIASRVFGIDTTKVKGKKELCGLIKAGIEDLRKKTAGKPMSDKVKLRADMPKPSRDEEPSDLEDLDEFSGF